MKNSAKKLIMVLVIVLTAQLGFATTYTTVQDGPWGDPNTWSPGIPPVAYTNNIININHKITLSSDINISYYKTTVSSLGEISGAYKIIVNSAGAEINNYGLIDVSEIENGYNSGDAKIDNYSIIKVSSQLIIKADFNNKYQSSSVHGYIEANKIIIESTGKLVNNHHIKVDVKLEVKGAGGITNSSSAILYVAGDADIIDNAIVNDGKFYIDGALTAPSWSGATPITGSGGTCNSDGSTAVANSNQACNSIGPIDVTFPIELLFFSAKPNKNQVEITWTTATEENNDYFTIERSQDGQNWVEVATIPGAGNSNTVLQYSFVDLNPLEGATYYHLKQTDYDGTSTFSEARVVQLAGNMDNSIKVYPNPTLGQFQMDVEHVDIREIHILNIIGQDVSATVTISQNGEASFTIDLTGLPKGMYFVQTPKASKKVYKQ